MEAAPRSLDHFPAAAFDRVDPTPDPLFYESPRYVVHIDDGAIAAVGALIGRLAPPWPRVLDLLSSYRSHLPPDLAPSEVVGIGLNAAEMAANPQLSRWTVQDLNADPAISAPGEQFDLALCTPRTPRVPAARSWSPFPTAAFPRRRSGSGSRATTRTTWRWCGSTFS
jgi:hypothetical protein